MEKASSLDGKPIELVFHSVHNHGVEITNRWTTEVERRSGNRVHFSQTIGGGPQLTARADAVRDVPAGGGKYHLLDLIQVPLIFPNAKVGSRAIAQLYAEFAELRDELSDVKVVGLSIGALMAIFSSRTWGPVRKLEDLRGARIRSLLPIDKSMAALGAKPLHVDYLDIARQLASGELDATVLGLLPAKMFKLAEGPAPYCTIAGELSITMHPMRTYMKWDSWNKLPADIQAVIDGMGPSGRNCWVAQQSGMDADSVLKGALDYFNQKGQVIKLEPAEQARWVEAIQAERQASPVEAESRGLPGRRFLARMQELVHELA